MECRKGGRKAETERSIYCGMSVSEHDIQSRVSRLLKRKHKIGQWLFDGCVFTNQLINNLEKTYVRSYMENKPRRKPTQNHLSPLYTYQS